MADQRNGGIAWTDETWNPVRGCSRVSEGCRNCYAETMAARFCGAGQPYEGTINPETKRWNGKVRLVPEKLAEPLRWQRPRMVFVNSMSDLFHDELVDCGWPLPNVWIGVTVENQETADERIPLLLQTPAAVRWVSMEPLLGAIDLHFLWSRQITRSAIGQINRYAKLNWIVCGGESGTNARPMHPDWVRSLRDQCAAANVPFLFKQWGEWAPHQARAGGDEGGDLRRGHVRYLQGDGREPDGHFRKGDAAVAHIGKKATGRLLDGVQHDGYPEVQP